MGRSLARQKIYCALVTLQDNINSLEQEFIKLHEDAADDAIKRRAVLDLLEHSRKNLDNQMTYLHEILEMVFEVDTINGSFIRVASWGVLEE